VKEKLVSLKAAVKIIKNGDVVAIGGSMIRRHPMAIIYEIVRQNLKDLTLIGWNNGLDMDLLIGAGCVKEVESSYIGLTPLGLAKNFRRAAENQLITVKSCSESIAHDKFRAGCMGLTFMPSKVPLGSAIEKYNPELKIIKCPYTGERYAALKAWNPDIAIIHAHRADRYGNVQFDAERLPDNDADIIIARSAKKTIISVEEIVDTEIISETSYLTYIPRIFVEAVVEAPFGAHPTECDLRYEMDKKFLEYYYEKSTTQEQFQEFLNEYVYGIKTHMDYLKKVSIENLFEIKGPKEVMFKNDISK